MSLLSTVRDRASSGPAEETAVVNVRCLLREQTDYVEPIETVLGTGGRFAYDDTWDPARIDWSQVDVLLCVNDWPEEVARCLRAAKGHGVPSLVLQDGILEWRCQYDNPLFGSGGGAPQHQPVLADKIACMGQQSARQIAAWGNGGRVEVTGMPRLDHLVQRPSEPIRTPGTRLLIMTAKNPGFTPRQLETSLRSLRDLREAVQRRPDMSVRWRVAGNVAEALGVVSDFRRAASEELADAVDHADAVVTTPSTAMVEAMVLGRPVAALDYHNVPRFVQTAWMISAPEHIDTVLDELLRPSANKLAFQQDALRDALELDGLAAPRVAELLRCMAAEGRQARIESRPLSLSPDLLGRAGRIRPGEAPALHALYPDAPAFADTDVRSLQARLARLEKSNEQLRRQISRLSLLNLMRRAGQKALTSLTGRRG